MKEKKQISTIGAISMLSLVIATVGILGIFLKARMEIAFFASWLPVILICRSLGYSFEEIQEAAAEYCVKAMSVAFIMFAVGAMIAAWIAAGTVPAMIYYGLQMVSPKTFLPLCFLLCSILSYTMGTSWGTVGTAGIALLGIGGGLNISPGWISGAVVSGAFLGDGISPMSSTNTLIAEVTQTDLKEHLEKISGPILLAAFVTLLMYGILGGLGMGNALEDSSEILNIQSKLANSFRISFITMIPFIFLLTLLLIKKPPLLSIMISAGVGGAVALFYQGMDAKRVMTVLWQGFSMPEGDLLLQELFTRGGMQSMFGLSGLFIITFGLIGMIQRVNGVEIALQGALKWGSTPFRLLLLTGVVAVLGNITGGTMNVAILLSAVILLEKYKQQDLPHFILSGAMSAFCTLGSVMVPWNANGIFVSSTLGVPIGHYAPYAFLVYLGPIGWLFFSWRRIGLQKKSNINAA